MEAAAKAAGGGGAGREFNGHQFVLVSFSNSAVCDVCSKPLLNKSALQCESTDPHTHTHTHTHQSIVSRASAAVLPLSAQAYFCDTHSPLHGAPPHAPLPLTPFSARSAPFQLRSELHTMFCRHISVSNQ